MVNLPAPFDPDPARPSSIGFTYRSEDGVPREIGAPLTSGGRFDAWIHPGTYRARLVARGTGTSIFYTWPDSVRVVPDSLLTFDVPLVPFEVDLLLGGRRDLAASLEVVTWHLPTQTVTEMIGVLGDGPLQTWGHEGSNRLTVNPREGAPFLRRRVFFELTAATTVTVDLGSHQLDVRVVNAVGEPWAGVTVKIDGEEGYRDLASDPNGWARFYLPSGSFRVRAEAGDLSDEIVVTVPGSSSIQLVLD
jgi:hypothetical protein